MMKAPSGDMALKTETTVDEDDDHFGIPQEIIDLHKRMDAVQEPLVRALGDLIGYGRLMQLAEQIWETKHPGGAHTTGPCSFFMVKCHHLVKDENGHCEVCCGAGRVTKYVASITQENSP
jgi:hypothetical protein